MRILHISDTHNKHNLLGKLPKADIIIHSGDVSEDGTEEEIIDFLNWFCDLDFRYKIFIAGNHDDYLFGANIEGLPENCFYLCNSGITIEGIKFYGIPMFSADALSGDYDKNIQKIPTDTNVLITHQPPYCILDSCCGDRGLLQTVLKIQPRFHLFGHAHGAHGTERNDNIVFVNATQINEFNEFANKPILLKICL